MDKNTIEQNKPDWAIGDLYRQAWKIIKTHKVLWLFGMAAGAGIGIDNIFNNSFSKGDFSNFLEKFNQDQKTPSEITQVLGSSTSFISDILLRLFSATPFYFYIILAIEFLFLLAIAIIINLVYKAWVTGSLLSSIQTAIEENKPTIKDSSAKAILHIKPLIWLSIVPIVVITLAAAVPFLFISIGLTLAGGIKNIFIFLFFIAIIVFLLAVFVLSFTQIWAQRQVVLNNKGGKEALFTGLKMVKKKFWSMLLLVIVNNILTGIIVAVPVGIIVGILFGSLFTSDYLGANAKTLVWIIVSLVMAITVLFVFFLPILGGIINAFKAGVWSIAYNSIKGKYDK